ncbi:MAG TPA: LacI family DNA-binding transcriptional regulator [Candidatus Didemnitutus sp.]|nr:LacI family DNA-binding transcriptional regulator [Candidatus Didemnitutus sp.]
MARGIPSVRNRIGLRDIAAAAGVSVMAVSLALRDNPKISQATRERIHRLADKLGYHPDPEITRLMRLLRSSRTREGRTSMAIVDLYRSRDDPEDGYIAQIRQGAATRAKQLGLGVTMIRGADYKNNFKQILNVIRARGLEGVILLPPLTPLSFESAVDWRNVSVVATTNSILAPRFHSVVPHQFANMMRLIELTKQRRHKVIVSIFDETFDDRTAHHFTAALNWHDQGERILKVPAELSPAGKLARIDQWIARHRPDVIFIQSAAGEDWAMARKRALRKIEVIRLGMSKAGDMPYLDERPDHVGSAATDLLAGMMYYHETGVPAHPRTTMIDCEFRFGRRLKLSAAT